jgi:hypothetical protein
MNDLTLLRDYGPDAADASPAALARAREQLMTEIATTVPQRRRLAPPTSKGKHRHWQVRLAVAAVAAAAIVAGGYAALPERHAPDTRPTGVHLVAFQAPVFPLGLRPRPAGLAAPTFSGGSVTDQTGNEHLELMAVYLATDGRSDVYLGVGDRYVPQGSPEETRSVDLNGRRAYLVERVDSAVVLSWQRRDNQWVTLTGNGRFATEAAVLALAATVVDQPQPVPLQVRLAPAGWRLAAFKDNRILTLHDPATKQSLSVNVVDQPTSDLMHQVMDARRVSPVRVNGAASELVETAYGWFLQVPLSDGSAFHLQAPTQLTPEQVIAIAEQVHITPSR